MEHGGRAACQGKVIHLNPANASTISIFEVPSRSSQVKLVARPKQQWIAILHHSEVGPPDVWSQHVRADWGARGSFPRKTRSPWLIYTSFLFKEWEPPFRLCVFQLWACYGWMFLGEMTHNATLALGFGFGSTLQPLSKSNKKTSTTDKHWEEMISFFQQLPLYQLSYDNSCSIAYFQCFASGSHNFRIGNDVFTARDAIRKASVGRCVSVCSPLQQLQPQSDFKAFCAAGQQAHRFWSGATSKSRWNRFPWGKWGSWPNHVFLVFWSDFQLLRFVCEGLSARKPMLIYLLSVVFGICCYDSATSLIVDPGRWLKVWMSSVLWLQCPRIGVSVLWKRKNCDDDINCYVCLLRSRTVMNGHEWPAPSWVVERLDRFVYLCSVQ